MGVCDCVGCLDQEGEVGWAFRLAVVALVVSSTEIIERLRPVSDGWNLIYEDTR